MVRDDGQSTAPPTDAGAETGPPFAASPEGASSPESLFSITPYLLLGPDQPQALSVQNLAPL